MSRFPAVHRIAPSDILAGQVGWPVHLVASRLAGYAWWNDRENDRCTPQPPDPSLVVLKEVRRTLAEGTWHLLALGTRKALLDRVEQRLRCRSGQQAGWAWCSSMRWTTPPCTR